MHWDMPSRLGIVFSRDSAFLNGTLAIDALWCLCCVSEMTDFGQKRKSIMAIPRERSLVPNSMQELHRPDDICK